MSSRKAGSAGEPKKKQDQERQRQRQRKRRRKRERQRERAQTKKRRLASERVMQERHSLAPDCYLSGVDGERASGRPAGRAPHVTNRWS